MLARIRTSSRRTRKTGEVKVGTAWSVRALRAAKAFHGIKPGKAGPGKAGRGGRKPAHLVQLVTDYYLA